MADRFSETLKTFPVLLTAMIVGGIVAVVGDERSDVGPETAIYLPPNIKHQLINTGDKPLRMFWVYSPPGAERAVLDGSQA